MENGLKILMNSFWCSKGWKNGYVSDKDFELAKAQGYMFEYPKPKSHDETILQIKNLVDQINPLDVANAFLYSLSTRKLEYRSALGSYYYAKSIPFHNDCSTNSFCYICGFFGFKHNPNEYEKKLGLNVFNFERYKWGGIRHEFIEYAQFDLEQFLKLPKVVPCQQDLEIFNSILKLIRILEPSKKIGSLIKMIISNKIFGTNKAEISTLLGILGICDVFNSKNHKGYLNHFTNNDSSRDPIEHNNDFKYPVNMWHAYDGVNFDAVSQVFNNQLLSSF